MKQPYDPTYDLVRSPKLPMTPEQLATYRPKPATATPLAETAKRVAYRSGIRELEPLVLRIEELERQVRFLKEQWVESAAH